MKFAYSLETVVCLTLPLLVCAAPHHTRKTTTTASKTTSTKSPYTTTTTSTKTTATAPPVTAPSGVAANYCGITGLSSGLSPYNSFAYNSDGNIAHDLPACENACLADNRCQSFFISQNTYASPAQATCELFDVPIDAYIADRGYNAGAPPPAIINYFYDRSICFPNNKPTPTKTPTSSTPPAVTVAPSIAAQYCDFPGDLPSQKPYNTYTFQYSGSDPADAASKNCEVNCLNDKKCLTYMVALVGGGYGQCQFYNAGFDQLHIQADESSAYFWDRNHCFPKYASSG